MAAAVELDTIRTKEPSPALFEWSDVSVALPEGKVLLSPNSGTLQAGELVCMIGPSGAGKTTLLSAIFGDKDLVQGSVYLAGEPLFANRRRSSRRRHLASRLGYVRQKDIFVEQLTVHETLTFTARLRMPDASLSDVEQRVTAVVKDMGLEQTLTTTLGTTMRRGISGGELKRVNIAAELLGMPKVLLLDEPTSGLDSTYALVVVRKLQSYVRAHGVGCLCTLHQPSAQVVSLLDRMVLMLPG
jgi:ABC-type multidrug transport system ATPase subunit